ncbi:hypothetical protein [Bacillus sp. CH30_1T]|uniref:hypothetical protein n=1 Tax=Bacillus sp. CH30_1T TaxID=2604836 RepID=UPI0021CD63D2|nr:hypothetical protein [Bacillus sp. CH30_1T]
MIKEDYPTFTIDEGLPEELWSSGINTIPEQEFMYLQKVFLNGAEAKVLNGYMWYQTMELSHHTGNLLVG